MIRIRKQGGAALIVSLVLMVIALLLGLSSFQSSRLEEQMAGNYRASVSALMAAEYGGAEAWKLFLNGAPNCGTSGWPAGYENIAAAEVSAAYSITCAPKTDADGNTLYGRYVITSTGRVNPNDSIFRSLQFETHLGVGPGAPIVVAEDEGECDPDSLIFEPPSSNAEITGEEDIDGNNRAAIQVACTQIAEGVVGEIIPNNETVESASEYDASTDTYTCVDDGGNNRLCNYQGGVQGGIDVQALTDANLLATFLSALQADAGTSVQDYFPSSDEFSEDGSVYFLSHGDDLAGVDTDANGRPTFNHSGDLDGKGVLVIDGNVDFNGVPSFDGLIIVLGDYIVSGGGGGEFHGSVVSAPIDQLNTYQEDGSVVSDTEGSGGNELDCGSSCIFADKTIAIGGGGTSLYNFDDDVLLDTFSLISDVTIQYDTDGDGSDETLSIVDLWGLEGVGLGDNYYIASWLETI
ncbi:PilX N-terminal domain-containing pilus assembly protein [Halomonas sp. M4R1S46]|uniref:pilus assembly PilX family protein n=1 Tax=Halomonas sp. M4R1S46 TaxID=2982692 RepID=UPI0021E3EAA3|nr:PilX N-terminal domain-containing pilus assembly protein [Halomonas sp. M4R1S46]UYG08083.1 PilX N-terminal domain-containing pilus assembly protein [Halomonas sp. M4R1S46]